MKQIILAFFGSLAPSIFFNTSRKNLVWAGLSGVTGWILYIFVLNTTGDAVLSVFAGSLAIGMYSEIMARILKTPATIYSLSGIFPIVPGVPAYNTIEYLVKNDLINAASTGIETIASAGAIAFGIMLMSAAFRFFIKIREELIHR
ncbi:MAG TPA: threonine/serine exporter [Clostridiaceae bacterium]|jgi:uncharacterized membrane protein YjjB (DUF3815 family)|nr:threonine/serine exporter [Clostridiaceae bacterium]